MKRFLMMSLLIAIAFGASAQGWRSKRKAKQAQEDNLPVMAVFKAVTDESFILYFNGEKVNEDPLKEVAVKKAELNKSYNVRVVLKSPYVVANMNFRAITIQSQGDCFRVRRNAKMDNVEIMTEAEYQSMLEQNKPKEEKIDKFIFRSMDVYDSTKMGDIRLDTLIMDINKDKRNIEDTVILNN